MNGKSKLAVGLVFVLALLLASASLVWAKELGLLMISGPGIKGQVQIKDQQALLKFEQSGFFDASKIVKAPEDPGEGYQITQYLNMEAGPVEWQKMVYYPAAEGEDSYIYWVGPLNPDAPQIAERWTLVQPAADQAFRSLLESQGVQIAAAPPEPAAAAEQSLREAVPANGALPASEALPAVENQPAAAAPVPAAAESQPVQPAGGISGSLAWAIASLAIASLAILAGGFLLLRHVVFQRGERGKPAEASIPRQ
jgi:hypothetical protein